MLSVNRKRKKENSDLAKVIRLVQTKIHGSNSKRGRARVKVFLKWRRVTEAEN